MISAQDNSTVGRDGPMTHRVYTSVVVCQALSGASPCVHVQFRRQGVTFCGRVAEMVEDFNQSGKEWFKVDSEQLGRVWVESKHLRVCSGDGRCTCEASQ